MRSAAPRRSDAPVRPAVTLLSGGLDSTTTMAIARRDGLTASAHDRIGSHRVELDAARPSRASAPAITRSSADLRRFGGSALTADVAVPKGRDPEAMTDIPVTYVPARNTIFLSLALAWAETLGAEDIFIGVNALDSSGYPDCRPEYIESFERTANLGTKAGVEGKSRFTIHTPLIALTKAGIVR